MVCKRNKQGTFNIIAENSLIENEASTFIE